MNTRDSTVLFITELPVGRELWKGEPVFSGHHPFPTGQPRVVA